MAKYAFLVGINAYANSKFNLRGCVNDVEGLARLLCNDHYGFVGGDIVRLLDAAATRNGILSGLEHLLSTAVAGDTIVFGFSGHGTQLASSDPDEDDVKDEFLVPHEGSMASLIRDDELRTMFDTHLKPGVNATAIYDCCHSATLYRTLEVDPVTGLFIEPVINRYLDLMDLADLSAFHVRPLYVPAYNILSACQDKETAADVLSAGPEGLSRGAFSYALHAVLQASPASPVALAAPQIAAGIVAVSAHKQTPNYQLADDGAPLIRY